MRVIAACIAVVALVWSLPAQAEETDTGSIAGIVTEAGPGNSANAPGSEKALEGICVQVYEAPKDLRFVSTKTGADGSYEVDGLESSSYHVWFRDCRDPSTHLAEWHEDAEMRGDATAVVVVAGETTEVDAALDLGGSISGVVTDEETDVPIEGIWIYVRGTDAFFFRAVTTGEDGRYRATGLPGGRYKLEFRDIVYPVDYVYEHYDDTDTFADADPVAVSLGRERTGIDAALEPMLRPDLTLEGVDVEEVPSEGDDQAPDPGFRHDVTVTVRNIGRTAAEEMSVEVEVCPRTIGDCRLVVRDEVGELDSGDTFTETYEWNALETGAVGDVIVRATAVEAKDLNFYNDRAEAPYHVLVEGTGFGVGL